MFTTIKNCITSLILLIYFAVTRMSMSELSQFSNKSCNFISLLSIASTILQKNIIDNALIQLLEIFNKLVGKLNKF